MLHFNCIECEKPLEVAEELVGKQIKCRHCEAPQAVPPVDERPPRRRQTPDPAPARPKQRPVRWTLLDIVRLFVWFGCFVSVASTLSQYPSALKEAKTAINQAFLAADACVWLIGAYVIARTIDSGLRAMESAGR